MSERIQYDADELKTIIKCDQVVIHFIDSDATLHAPGCRHRADEVSAPITVSGLLADDWFYVAPCAQRKPRA